MPDEIIGTCDRCGLEKITYSIFHNPIHVLTEEKKHVDICIICGSCMEFFLAKMKEFLDA